MRKILFIFYVLCFVKTAVAQKNNEKLAEIKDQIEIIDSYIDSEVFSLEHEEFMNRMADHGAELNGYYEHERLKKMIKKIGEPRADVITEYYFWNDQLIYVNYKQRPYFETKNDYGQTILDYSNAFTKYEAKHYFVNEKVIWSEKKGSPLKEYPPESGFVKYANKMKSLLDNKYYNKDLYQALQGKWMFLENSDDYIIFDGTIRFNFYGGRFANRLKTKIEEGVLTCWFPKDNKIYQYQIKEIDDKLLTLTDMFTKEDFVYAKIE